METVQAKWNLVLELWLRIIGTSGLVAGFAWTVETLWTKVTLIKKLAMLCGANWASEAWMCDDDKRSHLGYQTVQGHEGACEQQTRLCSDRWRIAQVSHAHNFSNFISSRHPNTHTKSDTCRSPSHKLEGYLGVIGECEVRRLF